MVPGWELTVAQRPTIETINQGSGVGIEIGCGGVRARPGYVTIDSQPLPTVDLVGDALTILGAIGDNKVDAVFASHFLEHVADVPGFVRELVRVSKPGARWEIIVPHFSCPYYYSDVTHRTFFGLYSFSYLATDDSGLSRRVPGYVRIPGLRVKAIRLGFRSEKIWVVRHALRKAWQLLFNANTYFKELYEDVFTGWVPCYQIFFLLEVE